MSVKRKISFIILLLCAVLMAFVTATSVSKYIFEHKDKIEGHYADIYMTHNGDGQTVIMEKDDATNKYVGYFNLTVSNDEVYDGQQLVSTRQLGYNIRTPNTAEIDAKQLTDAWGETFPLYGADSGNYSVKFSGVGDEQTQTLGKDAVDGEQPVREAKTYIVEVSRDGNVLFGEGIEEFDVIIALSEPYTAYRVFTVKASTGLISVGADSSTHFGFDLVTLRVATAKNYTYTPSSSSITFEHPAKLVLSWDKGVSFDTERFKETTAGSLSALMENEDYVAGYRLGTSDNRVNLTLYLPQGSNLTMYFYVPSGYEITAHAWFSEDGSASTEYEYDNIAGVSKDGVVQSVTRR
ncbi:MAG: hypothetical protein DBX59_08635 [Bacillota bacterium]|nr:MAG: hypothetical protein DBX59_08635 [Bacillota bacterium]